MKVAFPTNRGEKIAKHSSFCQSFLIVDTQSGARYTVANPIRDAAERAEAKTERRMKKGRTVAALLAEAGAEACVCVEAKAPFAQRLAEQGIALYIAEERQVGRALEALKAEEITRLEPEHRGDEACRSGYGREGNRHGAGGRGAGQGGNRRRAGRIGHGPGRRQGFKRLNAPV
jgi:predicted Fe-Mo cluster-binding NifX family protein